mmetsp:Transcript_109025/g.273192  ORF Transcript_109025/g.273192 Transcript_109025/m.273192 type:complete len:204 (-) Transcript_109025:140-751(-)
MIGLRGVVAPENVSNIRDEQQVRLCDPLPRGVLRPHRERRVGPRGPRLLVGALPGGPGAARRPAARLGGEAGRQHLLQGLARSCLLRGSELVQQSHQRHVLLASKSYQFVHDWLRLQQAVEPGPPLLLHRPQGLDNAEVERGRYAQEHGALHEGVEPHELSAPRHRGVDQAARGAREQRRRDGEHRARRDGSGAHPELRVGDE